MFSDFKFSDLLSLIDVIISPMGFLFILILIIIYQIIIYFLKNRKWVRYLSKLNQESLSVQSYKNLKEQPLVNIIIPAWNEGEIFRRALKSITELTYPKLKVIINAGGSKKTMKIANFYREKENFLIITQKQGGGKIKAINDALKYASEGILYFIDADMFLNDSIFLEMISPLINNDKKLVCSLLKPHKSQTDNDLVKYIFINRLTKNKNVFLRESEKVTPHFCMKFEVFERIRYFPEGRLVGDGDVMKEKIQEEAYKTYRINDFIQSFNPENIKEYITQNMRWIQNYLFDKKKEDYYLKWFKFIILTIISLFLIIFPILILIDFDYFFLGLIIFFAFYFKKIREFIFFIKIKDYICEIEINFIFFLKLIFYIYIDFIINVYLLIEIIFYGKKKFRKRKNIFK